MKINIQSAVLGVLSVIVVFLLIRNFTREEHVPNVNYEAIENRLDSLEGVFYFVIDSVKIELNQVQKREENVSRDSIKIIHSAFNGDAGRKYRDSLRAIHNPAR